MGEKEWWGLGADSSVGPSRGWVGAWMGSNGRGWAYRGLLGSILHV